jgi:hypothetical protein
MSFLRECVAVELHRVARPGWCQPLRTYPVEPVTTAARPIVINFMLRCPMTRHKLSITFAVAGLMVLVASGEADARQFTRLIVKKLDGVRHATGQQVWVFPRGQVNPGTRLYGVGQIPTRSYRPR